MTAKKEALMNTIRAEMTLLSVQELMNVRSIPVHVPPRLIVASERHRKMLRKVYHQAWFIPVKFRTGP